MHSLNNDQDIKELFIDPSSFVLRPVYILTHLLFNIFQLHHTHSEIEAHKSKNYPQSLAMAQEFLKQLLQIENTVQIGEHRAATCMICLEAYGTLNSTTGTVELPVRLPCSHRVGTVCIATWLRNNNSCPACRATFFPAPPRPYLEHGIINARPSENARRMGGRDYTDPIEICDWLCERLALDGEVRVLAVSVSEPLSRKIHVRDHDLAMCNAVISVYIAWHLQNRNDNIAGFLANLSRTSGIPENLIRSTYRYIHPNRMELIEPDILPRLARLHMDGIMALLPTPDLENGPNNSDEYNDGESRTSDDTEHDTADGLELRGRLARIRGRLWEEHSEVDRALREVVEDLYYEIIESMDDYPELANRSAQFRMGASVFMACHLMGVEISYGRIARLYSVDERVLRKDYTCVFSRRNELIDSEIVQMMGTGSMERVLGALPALNWPSL